MKKRVSTMGVSALSIGLLLGCSDEEISENNSSVEKEDEQISVAAEENSSGLPEKNDFNSDDDSTSQADESDIADQLDLRIGDSALIETTLGLSEITINSIKIEESFNEQDPELDLFIIADVTVTNKSNHSQNVEDIVDILEITPDLDGSGYSEVSMHYDGVDTFTGEMGSDETLEGQLLYQSVVNSEQIIRVNPGLVASEAVKNDVMWTFSEQEIN